jgi:tRNA(Arg) A34 adenosine deaminase TadA
MTSAIPILDLPTWLPEHQRQYRPIADHRAQMEFVVAAARANVEQETGGPFAAGIFAADSGALVSLGVNLVTSHHNCVLHAEVVAIMLAQRRLGTYDLGAPGGPAHELVSSSSPCAMCVGATCWSGVRAVVYGAEIADAEAIGFDEGPVAPDWQQQLARRGIAVVGGVLRERAAAVLNLYAARGGVRYNPGGRP